MSGHTPDNKLLNHDEMAEAELPDEVIAFQDVLCDACTYANDGECVKDDDECPMSIVAQAHKRGG
ncbi:MAG: hypothetical protein ACXVIG_04785 [Halobacteriota archaeon]